MIAIAYLDGHRLSRSVIAGAHFVAERAEALNKINVFPVPDGDTGTNVASTLQKVASAIGRTRQRHIREMSKMIADLAVGGARGNSGAILAQFFCGFSVGLPDSPRGSTPAFGAAVVRAAESAYSAIARPVEGTILSVIRDWARYVADRAAAVRDFGELLPDSLKAARASLENTPKQMKALQKAGVVDAGGQGFVYLLEGVVRYLREAALLGESLVIAGGASRVRLHAHTNEPERLVEAAARFGDVAQTKVEDMRAQHESRFDKNRAERVGVVTDSTCDLPDTLLEELRIGVVPVRVYFGSENYLDKVTITPAEFYARFSVTDVAPKTSQPPPADFTQVYENVAEHAGSIVSVHLSSGLSGTYQAAIVGARPVQKTRFEHVDSRTASVGLGLVVRAAAEEAAAGKSAAQVSEAARSAAERVRTFVAVPTLKHLVRGGRVSPLRGWIARMLGLLPILTITREGKAEPAAKARGYAAARRKMMSLLFAEAGERASASRRFGIAHCDAEDAAEELAREIRERYPESDVMIVECGPALGAHGGPGALAVAVLPE